MSKLVPSLCDSASWPRSLAYYTIDGRPAVLNAEEYDEASGKQEPVKNSEGEVELNEDGSPKMRWVEIVRQRFAPAVNEDVDEACAGFIMDNIAMLEADVLTLDIHGTNWDKIICVEYAKVCPNEGGDSDDGRTEL